MPAIARAFAGAACLPLMAMFLLGDVYDAARARLRDAQREKRARKKRRA